MKKQVCVIGLGYIGLPTATLLANKNYQVLGIDVHKEIVDTINKGEIHIVEPGLDTFAHAAVTSGNLVAALEPTPADIFIIAVPTPFKEDLTPDISFVLEATKTIAPFIKDGNLVILESTSPVGTTHKVEETLKTLGVNTSSINIAYCPERVLPGKVMKELIENDRIVGGTTHRSTEIIAEFYEEFVEGEVIRTKAKTAELCKLAENSSRDVQIAFANELSIICDKAGVNVWELIDLANRHPRVNILQPGSGVGGHCIAVDPWFIVSDFQKESKIIRTAREQNDYKTEWVIEKIQNSCLKFELENSRKPVVGILGLSFKPNIDDLRESPSISIVNSLSHQKIDVLCVEPNIKTHSTFNLISLDQIEDKCDIVVYLVAHKEFKKFSTSLPSLDFCGIRK